MKYFDINSGEIVTLEKLYKEYEILISENNISGITFDDYIKECTGKNGSLIIVWDVIK